MKQALLITALLLLAGCKPFPAEAQKNNPAPQETATTVQVHVQTAPEPTEEAVDDEPKPVIDEDIAPNNRVISVATSGNNYQSVKRVEYPDASCFVVMNSKTWEGGISCIRK